MMRFTQFDRPVGMAIIACGLAMVAFSSGDPGTDRMPLRSTGHARSGAMQALEFWSQARVYPDRDLSPDKYYRAFEQAGRVPLKREPHAFATSAWNYIGPTNLTGRTLSLAINPENRNTLYAGSASGGLWRSYTGGLGGDWERVSTGHPVLGVAAIAIVPDDSTLMYIGTGEVYRYGGTAGGIVIRTTRGSYGMGILKSTDAGISWTKSLDWSYHQERGVQAIRVNPQNSSTVWAATTEGLYRTTDAGQSWSSKLAITMAQDIVIHPTDTLLMLASLGNLGLSNYVLKSTDGGNNWLPVTPIDFNGKTLLAQFAGNPEVVYASIADSTTGVGSLWRTDNFGDSWVQLSDNTDHNIFGVQGWYSHFVAVHPVDSTKVFHAAVQAARSSDGGYTFGGVGGTYSDHHAYAIDPVDPEILYVANDDGVYRSTNFGSNFSKVSDNLGIGQFYAGFSSSASDSVIALGQVQDHIPGYLYTGSPVWPRSAADEVGWTAIDQTNDFIMYAGTRGGGSVRKSIDRGNSFPTSSGGFSGLACWNAPFLLSSSHPNILYFGRSRIFKSINAADSWSATNGGVELDGNPALSMAMSSLGPDTVYVGTAPRVTRTHLFLTTNGGSTWTDITGPLPDRYPLDIAVNPSDAAVAYVGYGGYGSGHVYKTTDAGITWNDLSGTLPDIPVTALLVDPFDHSIVYLGSDLGVYLSTDGGVAWVPFGEGLPEAVLVSDLTMTPSNRTLRAATHGNGVFERKIPPLLPSVEVVAPAGGETWETGSVETISWNAPLVGAVDVDYSTDDGSTWITVAAALPAWPDSLPWTVPATLTTGGRVRVRSSLDTNITDQSGSAFTIFFDGVVFDLAAGWNLVSVPVGVPDLSRTVLFPGAVGKAYSYAGAYSPRETLDYGEGYWLNHPGPTLIPLSGDSIRADTISLVKGWNLVGSLSLPVPAGALFTIPPSLLSTSLFGYDGTYFTVDSVMPGLGYWVKSLGAGLLVIDADLPAVVAADAGPGDTPGPEPGEARLTFTDARGRSASLYITGGSGDGSGRELPPPPPNGGFDVRFDGGSMQICTDERAYPVRLSGISYPMRLRWSVPPGSSYEVTTPAGNTRMEGEGEALLPWAEEMSIRRSKVGSIGVPGGFILSQNYPNPFNPETRIRFTVPELDLNGGSGPFVSLRVYDIAGRLVEVLLEKHLPPGIFEVDWRANDRPGGVYFALLRSGETSLRMKMLLVR